MTPVKYLAVPLVALVLGGTSTPRAHPGGRAGARRRRPPKTSIPSLLAGLRWRSIGPARGGRSQAVAGSTKRPLEYYFGAVGGGVWKTTDGGVNWRAGLGPRLQVLVGRRHRGLRIQSGRRLRRHGRDAAARQHHPGRRRLQDHRRRPDLDARRPREDAGDRPHPRPSRPIPTSSTSPRSAIRTASTPDRGVFKSTDGGKTWTRSLFRDDKTGAVDLSMDAEVAGRPLCRPVGGLPDAALALERRTRQRAVQVHRRRRDVDRADEESRPAEAAVGQDRRQRLGRRSESRLRADRSAGRRALSVGRCGRDVEAGERRPQHPPARLLLHPHLRRSAGEGHGLHPQRVVLSIDRRRQDAAATSASRTATTTICGSRRTIRSG